MSRARPLQKECLLRQANSSVSVARCMISIKEGEPVLRPALRTLSDSFRPGHSDRLASVHPTTDFGRADCYPATGYRLATRLGPGRDCVRCRRADLPGRLAAHQDSANHPGSGRAACLDSHSADFPDSVEPLVSPWPVTWPSDVEQIRCRTNYWF